jgi:hypothetical protein
MVSRQLADWTIKALKAEAKRRGLKGLSRLNRGELVELLADKATVPDEAVPGRPASATTTETTPPGPTATSQTPVSQDPVGQTPGFSERPGHTEDAPCPARSALLEFVKEQSELPHSYHRLRAVLIPKNPEWAFFYWDLDRAASERLAQADGGGAVRIYQDDVPVRTEAVSLPYRRHYVAIPDPGGRIRVELGGLYSGTFIALMSSNALVVEPNRASDDLSAQFVVPRWVDSPYEDRQPPASWRRMDTPATLPGIRGDVPWYQMRDRVS